MGVAERPLSKAVRPAAGPWSIVIEEVALPAHCHSVYLLHANGERLPAGPNLRGSATAEREAQRLVAMVERHYAVRPRPSCRLQCRSCYTVRDLGTGARDAGCPTCRRWEADEKSVDP